MGERAGPQAKRVRMADGSDVFLPADAVVHPQAPAGMTDDEARAWLARRLQVPLSGTY